AGVIAEKRDEDPLWRRHVGVHEDSDGFAGMHCSQHSTDKIVFVEGLVAAQRPVTLDQRVHSRMVKAAHHQAHGMAVSGMRVRADLPSAEMAGEHDHPFTPSEGGGEVLKSFVDCKRGYVVG